MDWVGEDGLTNDLNGVGFLDRLGAATEHSPSLSSLLHPPSSPGLLSSAEGVLLTDEDEVTSESRSVSTCASGSSAVSTTGDTSSITAFGGTETMTGFSSEGIGGGEGA